jgi:CPA2 family monovalent cation:H+ antiporter-2
MGIASDLVLILIAALLGGAVAHVLKLPLLIGYILAGIIVGPHTGGASVENIHDIEMLAEIGVALLLFSLGLEFSFSKLKQLYKITLFGTPLQLLACWFLGYLLSSILNISHTDAVWIGAAIALSSTMVVMKILVSRRTIDSESGRLMISILIAQDIAIVPMMLVLPQISATEISAQSLFFEIVKSSLLILSLYFLGSRLLPRFFSLISSRGSRELFFLTTLAIALGTAFLFSSLGLSFALGAFVVGMLLSESDFNHQALSSVSNLKDLFSLLFFVSVGMLFDPSFFADNVMVIISLVLTIVLFKAIIIGGIVKLFGFSSEVAWISGLGLAQVGEFAFIIINSGSKLGYLSHSSFSLVISATVASMILTPGLFWLGMRFSRLSSSEPMAGEILNPHNDLERHIIIVGAGVVGRYLANALKTLNKPHIIIEIDYKIVLKLRDQDYNIIFGDASERTILKAANISKASLIVITTTNDSILPALVSEIKALRNDLPIIARVEEVQEVDSMLALKLEEVVQPQMEVGLEMLRQSLLALKFKESQIISIISQMRAANYKISLDNKDTLRFLKASDLLDISWVAIETLARDCRNLKLKDAKIRENYGVSVVAVIRGEQVIPTPDPELELNPGDILALIGTRTQLDVLRSNP